MSDESKQLILRRDPWTVTKVGTTYSIAYNDGKDKGEIWFDWSEWEWFKKAIVEVEAITEARAR